MSSFFTILLIGISLSMDAFSLALIYGMQGMSNKQKLLLSIIVGIYHFIMPLIGLSFGTIVENINIISIQRIITFCCQRIDFILFFSPFIPVNYKIPLLQPGTAVPNLNFCIYRIVNFYYF